MSDKSKLIVPGVTLGLATAWGLGAFMSTRETSQPAPRKVASMDFEGRKRRRQLIKSDLVHIDLRVTVLPDVGYYYLSADLTFDLEQTEDLTLDFQKPTIKSLRINKHTPDRPMDFWSARQILLPKEWLVRGSNQVSIQVVNPYDKVKRGLVKLSEDEIIPLLCGHTASLVFPCFDQLDIRCSLNLTVCHPVDRRAISVSWPVHGLANVPFEWKQKEKKTQLYGTTFQPVPSIAVHNIGFFVGKFPAFESSRQWQSRPVRFVCRMEMKEKMMAKAAFLEKVVFGVMEFLTAKLRLTYPYDKIKLVFVRDAPFGLDYPSSIIMEERFLEVLSPAETTEAVLSIGHELVHTWFGNQTNASDYGCLFLHEAVANYLSFLAMESFQDRLGVPFLSARTAFLITRTRKAHICVRLHSSHGVNHRVERSELANSAYDDITYNKGEALLHYFHENLGDEAFFESLHRLATVRPWQTIGMADFVGAFPEHARSDVAAFFDNNRTDMFKIKRTEDEKGFRVIRTEYSWLTWLKIQIRIIDLVTGESVSEEVDLGKETIEVGVPAHMKDYVIVFNSRAKAFCVWKHEPKNLQRIIKNALKIPRDDLLGCFLNLANLLVIKNEDPTPLLFLFMSGYPLFKDTDFRACLKALSQTFNKKYLRADNRQALFEFLMGKGHLHEAVSFLSTPKEATEIIDALDALSVADHARTWRKLAGRLTKWDLLDHRTEVFKRLESSCPDSTWANHLMKADKSNLEAALTTFVLERQEDLDIDEYVAFLKVVKGANREETLGKAAIHFLENLGRVAEPQSDLFIFGILRHAIPNRRYSDWRRIKLSFEKAINRSEETPLVKDTLLRRLEELDLYN